MTTQSLVPRNQRPKYMTCKVPPCLFKDLDELKIDLQNDEIKITSRQVIGKDGIALAAVTYLLSLPREEQKKLILEGIKRYNSLES